MALSLLLAILGTIFISGYLFSGDNDAILIFGMACVSFGSSFAVYKDLQLSKELKSLREFHSDVLALTNEFLDPDITAFFDDTSLAELYAERQIKKGYRAVIKESFVGKKSVVQIYKGERRQ